MILLTEPAPTHLLTPLLPLISDVKPGMDLPALSALKTGHSTPMESANKFPIAAKLTLDSNAQAATMASSLRMVFAISAP